MSTYISQCGLCAHAWDRTRRGDPPRSRCDAFPEGIPDEILRNEVVHNKPYPGDHGIHYEYFESGRKPKATKKSKQESERAHRASHLLKQVSDPTRLQVMLILAEGEFHVGAICEQLRQSQPAVSHHLALMRHGGIVAARREGKNNFYGLTTTGSELVGVLEQLSPPRRRNRELVT